MEIVGPAPARPLLSGPALSEGRARVLDALRDAAGPTTVAALADALGVHPNTVREHLDALVTRRLATRTAGSAAGRGRPAWTYLAEDGPAETDPRIRDYAALATALAGQIALTSQHPEADALAAGEAWGRELSVGRKARTPAEARCVVVDLLAELGFHPETNARSTSIRLRRCPVLEAARARPDVVCPVHLGLVRGVLSELGGNPEGAQLKAFSEPGACRLDLSAAPPPAIRSGAQPQTDQKEPRP